MFTTFVAARLFLGLSLAALPQPPAASSALTIQQQTSLRCAAAFAIVAQGQVTGDREALAYPPLEKRGREFFVRAAARIMDEAGLDRDQIGAALSAEARDLRQGAAVDEAMPACLLLLDASAIPDRSAAPQEK